MVSIVPLEYRQAREARWKQTMLEVIQILSRCSYNWNIPGLYEIAKQLDKELKELPKEI